MTVTRVFHLDTGGCGACALEVWATVETSPELQWASSPLHADVVALTGSLTAATRELVLTIYRDYLAGRVPIVVVGRCAIDGYPYGKGGIKALDDMVVQGKIMTCPPPPAVCFDCLLSPAAALSPGRLTTY